MVDFSHLRQYDVKTKTAEYTVDQISINGVSPVLTVKPATEANKPYLNHLLKTTGKKLKRGKVNADTLDQAIADDRSAYPEYIITGWSNVIDADGSDAPFSKKACKEFLACLPDWIFNELRAWCGDPSNFVDVVDVEVLAKN